MKYQLAYHHYTKDIEKIVSREIRKQRILVLRAKKAQLKELSEISYAIKNWGLPRYLICKKLPKGLGWGIFLRREASPIPKGQWIAPYSGELSITSQNHPDESVYAFSPIFDIHLTKNEQAHFDKKRLYRSNRLYAFNVDAVKKGNFTRFINHSDHPNIVANFYRIPANQLGLPRSPLEVIYLAKKRIHPGEQLLVNYEGDEPSYWSSVGIKPIPITPKTFQVDHKGKLII